MKCTLGERLRQSQYRIGGIALLDLGLTVLGVFVVSHFSYPRQNLVASRLGWFSLLFGAAILLGIGVHAISKMPTMLNYYLGISSKPKIYKC